MYLHINRIYVLVHYSNAYLQTIWDIYNTYITIALRHLGALFHRASYQHSLGNDPFTTSLSRFFHQYDNYTQQDITRNGQQQSLSPHQHTTMEPRNHHIIASNIDEWNRITLTKVYKNPIILAYTHGLVSTLPSANYSRTTMNSINHIYIGILPRSPHTIIQRYFSTFVIQQQRAHERSNNRKRPPILWSSTMIMLLSNWTCWSR